MGLDVTRNKFEILVISGKLEGKKVIERQEVKNLSIDQLELTELIVDWSWHEMVNHLDNHTVIEMS